MKLINLDSLEEYKKGDKYAIPIRSMVVAPKDFILVQWDLKQAESWVVAFLANEPRMKDALQFGDIHALTAKVLFGDIFDTYIEGSREYKSARYIGKRFNHATAYRMGPHRATEVVNKDSDKPPYVTITLAESKDYMSRWHEFYYLGNWWMDVDSHAASDRTLVTPYDRVRTFFAQFGNELSKEMTAHVPQSTVADHTNGAVQEELGIEGGLLTVYERFVTKYPDDIRLINQSHDSGMAEVRKSALHMIPEITALMLRPLVINGEQFTIPVDCEMGERWGQLKAAA